MLKHGEPNPLNIFGLRKVEYCPPHFETVTFEPVVTLKTITDWIYENLEGRFFVGPVDISHDRHLLVGFELPSEASYFSLFIPQINHHPDSFY